MRAPLFSFLTFNSWVNCAQRAFASRGLKHGDTYALDKAGRRCVRGQDCMRARDEGTFPVDVFLCENEEAEPRAPLPV
jgi:hypothetical protein